MSAGVTPVEMAPERGRATARDRAEHGSLLHAQPRMLLDERCHPARGGYRPPPPQAGSRLDAASAAGATAGGPRAPATCSCSNGFGAACRVAPRQVQVDRGVREVGVAEEELGSCGGRRRPPADASRTNVSACAG